MAATKKPTARTPRKKKRSSYHHGDLRDALLEEALVLIQERGPEAFTLKELATRLGVTHTAPYRHFADKQALLTAVATAGFTALHERIAAALARTEPGLRARFLAGAYAYVRFAVERPAHFRAMYFGPRRDDEDATKEREATSAFGLLLEFIVEAQARGTIGAGEPRALALPIWAMHHGLASLACNGPFGELPPRELKAIVEDAHLALLDGLAAGEIHRLP